MARDRFKVRLKCPICGIEAVAALSQEDGWSFLRGNLDTEVDVLPPGFKVVKEPSGFAEISLYCAVDDVHAHE